MDYLNNSHVYFTESVMLLKSDYRGFVICEDFHGKKWSQAKLKSPKEVVLHLKEQHSQNEEIPSELFDLETYKKEHFSNKEFTAYSEKEQEIIDSAIFNACKFGSNHHPLPYDYENEDLEYIKYRDKKKNFSEKLKEFRRTFEAAVSAAKSKKLSFRSRYLSFYYTFKVRHERNQAIPDASVNGNLYHWDEDACYAVYFQPLVGMEVLRFLQAEPNNPWAQKIMKTMAEASHESFTMNKKKKSKE